MVTRIERVVLALAATSALLLFGVIGLPNSCDEAPSAELSAAFQDFATALTTVDVAETK